MKAKMAQTNQELTNENHQNRLNSCKFFTFILESKMYCLLFHFKHVQQNS